MDQSKKETNLQEEKVQQIKQKQPIKKQENNEQGDINKLISQFQTDNLNLTDEGVEEQQEDAEAMKKVKQQYQKFMKQLGQEGESEMGVGNLGKVFEDLLKGLGEDEQSGEQIGKKFSQMFNNMDDPTKFQDAASKLLNQFMDKSLLEQPLRQTKQNYEKYFQELKQKNTQIPEDQMNRYHQQLKVINELIQTLEKQPTNKQKMIGLFSDLQQKGDPPEGIAPSYGFF